MREWFLDKKNIIQIFWASLFLICLGVCIYAYRYLDGVEHKIMKATIQAVKVDVNSKLNRVELEFNKVFNGDEESIDKIAEALSSGKLKVKDLPGVLAEAVEANNYLAIAANFARSYKPDVLRGQLSEYRVKTDTGAELYAPFFLQGHDGKHTVFPYDYTDTESGRDVDWYNEGVAKGEWYGPYFGAANDQFLISYRAPIDWDPKTQSNQGLVVADYSLERVRDIIQGIKLLDSGYLMIVNSRGKVISHPVQEYLSQPLESITNLNLDFQKVRDMEANRFYEAHKLYKSNKAARARLIFKRDLPERGWSVLVVLNKSETLVSDLDSQNLGQHFQLESAINAQKTQFLLFVGFTLFVLSLALTWGRPNRYWLGSTSFSVICLGLVVFIWYNNQVHRKSVVNETVEVENKTDLEAALNTFRRLQLSAGVEAEQSKVDVKIATGFFIQSVKFASSNDVFVTGYAWQSLPRQWQGREECKPKSAVCLGFILPEAESVNMRVVHSDESITRWYFEASLRQEFNYLKYPFDEERVWIRARPKDFYNQGTTLVPDFDAYPSFEGDALVGLEQDIFVEGWSIAKTFYSFKLNEYTSNFGGSSDQRIVQNRPDLYFNITIRREFLGVFVAYMIPIMVTAFLLFAVLMIRTSDTELNGVLGYDAATVLGFSASLFFVLVISHMSIRETLNAKGIIYLEYFFFSLYVAIAIVSVNSIIFTFRTYYKKPISNFLQYVYWPGLLLSLLFATVLRFS